MKDRKLLMIPGPIEFDPAVLAAMSLPTTSHVAANFIDVFGQAIEKMRQVWLAPDGQPIILAGSGTLAMDTAAANLIEPFDKALVINTGYFSDRFGLMLERYGATVTHLRAPLGGRPAIEEVEQALQQHRFKLMTVTHVDTSTAVINDVKALAALAKKYDTLIVVDGVCSVAGEELRMTEWGIDVALTASQKAIGVPPGLALLVASPRAIESLKKRETPVMNYYADWNNWLPIMEAYEARKAGYFGTPAVNLVWALNVSLDQILKEGMEARVKRHRALSRSMQTAIKALGLGQVPLNAECAAHTLSAPRYPQGVAGTDLLPRVLNAGAIIAGGLHPEARAEYFRIGHMGACSIGDLIATIGALEIGLAGCGYKFEAGVGVAAAMAAYH